MSSHYSNDRDGRDHIISNGSGIEYRERERLLYMTEFEDLINKGMYNIYDNIKFKITDIKNIKPLNISEVMKDYIIK